MAAGGAPRAGGRARVTAGTATAASSYDTPELTLYWNLCTKSLFSWLTGSASAALRHFAPRAEEPEERLAAGQGRGRSGKETCPAKTLCLPVPV